MAVLDIGWTSIAANSSTDWFIHGYNNKQAVTYSIVVFPGSGAGVPFPAADATLYQGRYVQANDGTFAQVVTIRNNAPFNSCDVHLLAQVESL
jgi:hypothetical protein